MFHDYVYPAITVGFVLGSLLMLAATLGAAKRFYRLTAGAK
jgi:hypothetical protein